MFDIFYIGTKPNLFAHERQVDSIEQAQQLSRTRYCWVINYLSDYDSFDFLWEPVPWQNQYIHVWPSQWHDYSGTFLLPKNSTNQYHFHQRIIPNKQSRENWTILHDIDHNKWDWSWSPHPMDPLYVYVWGNQWWSGEKMPTVEYRVPGATEVKYMDWPATLLPSTQNWHTHFVIDNFDYSWAPDPGDPPYIYVFGNQHWPGEIMPTVEYCVPGATEIKYLDYPRAKLSKTKQHWEVCEQIDQDAWDWSWVPNPLDPPYVYVFGNQWNPAEYKASVKYTVPGATEIKYMDLRTCRLPQPALFRHNLPVAEFDYSWEPNPFDPPMTYVFGNQWNSAVLEPTIVYSTGGTEIKYMDHPVAKLAQDISAWEMLDDIAEFDYSWRPNPTDPPYIYVFGNQWLTPEQRPALKYTIPGAVDIKYMDYPKARRHGDPSKFIQRYSANFDWSWEPDPGSPPYNYVFGNQYYSAEVMPTVEYHMEGATDVKYMDIPATLLPRHDNHWHTLVDCDWDYSWRPEPGSPPYIYVFGNQWWPAEKMATLEYHMEGATERKYMAAPVANLLVDMTHWHIPEHVDVTDMDFSWVPDPGEPPYIYQFATQHQKTGGPQYHMPGAVEVKYVDMMRAEVKKEAAPIFEIDHLDGNAGQMPDTVKKIRYFDNYRDTLIRLAKSLVGQHEHVWVCSSICDYSNFDFTWHPETWQSTMLHVFASDKEKFGDTFYMHVPTFAERAEKKALLEWYSVNYVPRKSVPRRPVPVIAHTDDTHVEQVKTATWAGPVALFASEPVPDSIPAVNLWREETKTIIPLTPSASLTVVPRVAVPLIKTQLYDYPHIDKSHRRDYRAKPMDIVFISYDEPEADRNWEILHSKFPNSLRVHGVAGMERALEAAADASSTPWYWAVFAKTELAPGFDFGFVPDYMQQPKHYIFNCRNMVNELEYGHMGMVLYNCQGIRQLNREGEFGLDYTLSFPHESVPILSCLGRFNTTPYHTWRTAFRESAKLAFFESQQHTVEGQYRLSAWLEKATGDYAEWCLRGAADGVEFFETTGGDLTKLKQSFRWEWLREYFAQRYGYLQ